MNPAFIILIFLGICVLWVLMSFVFYPLGKILYRIGKDAFDEMNRKDNE